MAKEMVKVTFNEPHKIGFNSRTIPGSYVEFGPFETKMVDAELAKELVKWFGSRLTINDEPVTTRGEEPGQFVSPVNPSLLTVPSDVSEKAKHIITAKEQKAIDKQKKKEERARLKAEKKTKGGK